MDWGHLDDEQNVSFQVCRLCFHLLMSKGRDVPTHPKQTAEAPVQLPCSRWDSVSQESRVSTQALVSLTVIPLASEGSLDLYSYKWEHTQACF